MVKDKTINNLRECLKDVLQWLDNGEVDGIHYDIQSVKDVIKDTLQNNKKESESYGGHTLEELIKIFCKERESLRQFIHDRLIGFPELADYFIDSWIRDAESCKTVSEFENIILNSLHMSLYDWFSGIHWR